MSDKPQEIVYTRGACARHFTATAAKVKDKPKLVDWTMLARDLWNLDLPEPGDSILDSGGDIWRVLGIHGASDSDRVTARCEVAA